MSFPSDLNEFVACNNCKKETWHHNVHEQIFEVPLYDDDELLDMYSQKWNLLRCGGCGAITIRAVTDFDHPSAYTEYFPPRTTGHHKRKFYLKLPNHLDNLYLEVVKTFNSGNYILCAAGLRALLEGLCEDKGITEGPNQAGVIVKNLEGKINGLVEIVPEGIVKNLHGIRFLGNQALHELEKPEREDLRLAMGIIEDILNIVYDLDYRAQFLLGAAARRK